MPNEQKTMNEDVLIDLNGSGNQNQKIDRVLVAEDAYDAVIKSVSTIETKDFESKQLKKKIVFQIAIMTEKGEVELPLFVNPVIKKSSGTKGYSNSKLYDLLDNAKLLEQVAIAQEQINNVLALQDFLAGVLIGKKCRVLVKTTNKGKENAYSSIKDIVKFF